MAFCFNSHTASAKICDNLQINRPQLPLLDWHLFSLSCFFFFLRRRRFEKNENIGTLVCLCLYEKKNSLEKRAFMRKANGWTRESTIGPNAIIIIFVAKEYFVKILRRHTAAKNGEKFNLNGINSSGWTSQLANLSWTLDTAPSGLCLIVSSN